MSETGTSRVPARARAVIAAVVVAGLAASGAVWKLAGSRGVGSIRVGAFLAVLIILTWVLPLMLYQGTNAICVHFDEACFVVLAMLVPPLGVLLWFTVALVLGHVFRRRPFVKCLFNFGHVTSTVAVGLLTVHLVGGSARPDTPLGLAAVALGVMAFLALNIFWLAALLAGLGQQSFRAALFDGSDLLLVVAVVGVVTGLVTGLAAASVQWIIPGTFVPFLVLRQVLAGHFRARQDRARLKGLFDATLQMHGEMGGAAVEDAIRAAATELLRGDRAVITDVPPGPGQLVAKLRGDGEADSRWLRIDGRKPLEPTEAADQAMLETLAAVGAGALANAALYEEVAEQRERLAAITASLGEGVCALDRDGRVTFLNPAGRTMLGVPRDDPLDAPIKAPASMASAALRCARSGSTVRNDDAVFEQVDGSPLAVGFTCSPVITGGEVTGAVVAFSDITERKAFEERLAHHAFHDTLTGLANRRLFLDHLDQAMLRSERQGEVHAVVFFDVDRFKLVNDNLGHQHGDELLKVVAARCALVTRAGDTLARFGGDEFILLVENVSGIEEAVNVAERVQAEFADPVILAGHQEIFVTASFGVALSTGQRSRDDVLHDADVAMYRAKGRGPGEIEVFDQGAMAARSAERLDIEAALRRGIERGEIEVHYQPIYDAQTTVITGAEALVRWNHPTRGFLSPAAFVPIAEDSGLILPLGRLVLESACRQAKAWHEEFDRTLDITVNLSARQFQHTGLTADIARILEETGMDSAHLCLEITETLAMADTGRTISILDTLKQLGVRLAIDDFGTGYSSLSYLKEFPVDVVKIDRSFVAGIGESDVDEAIVAAVVALSRAVRMSTVAEGVETAAQLAHLVALGCDRVQGFYLAKPMPAASFTSLLGRQFVLQDA